MSRALSQGYPVTAWSAVNRSKTRTDGIVTGAIGGYDLDQVEWYIDTETGKTLKRPAFTRLQNDIFDGKVRTVICWKLDRLSRRLRDGVNLLADWCEKGIKIITPLSGSN